MSPGKFSVEGKVTIVTGGGTGVGAGIAHTFAMAGAPVLIASRKADNLAQVRDRIRADGGVCEYQVCDVPIQPRWMKWWRRRCAISGGWTC